ncbi:2,3-bisphosphoglycerate-independent phosphoglycerate mutase [Tasmannia lanceolata]|uniref:2,3-bisphosphoglycerate-independent phosphoglycerate mutase n=1 Tax=Tasmannia lanceolata TaxID=3420 RepID=UPI0040630E4B
MDLVVGRLKGAESVWSISRKRSQRPPPPSPLKPRCSRDDSGRPPEKGNNGDKGDRLSIDWDKAWSSFRKQGKKSLFSQFIPDKYVTWNPRRTEYPLSEEIDPIKRTERSNLMLWTSPKFTLVGAIVVVSALLIYTLLVPLK